MSSHKTKVAMPNSNESDNTSTSVVINGLAITAGSSPKRFASKGNVHPNNFAKTTVIAKVMHAMSIS